MVEFDQKKQQISNQINATGDVNISHLGDNVGGDKITVGDITSSYAAIGAGAQVIIGQIQQALSAVDEMEKGIRVAERRLAESIQRLIGRYTSLTATIDDDRANPYKSLLDYKLEDSPYFYGRAEAITTALDKLANHRLLVLHAESGSGKTSLIQAGLGARLLSVGHFPLYIRPYRTPPGSAIRRAFLPDYQTQPDLSRFTRVAMSLRGFLERVTFYLGSRRLIIFLDQFEEFFSELSLEDRQHFAQELQDCIESDLNIRWVLSLRKEYFSDMRLFRAVKPYDNEFFLPTFKIEEGIEVIVEPAMRKGVKYEAGLVERIVADLRQGQSGLSPAHVQLVCYTLFDELSDGAKTIINAQYDTPRGRGAIGAEGILSSHLSRVLERDLAPMERAVAVQILEALVTSEKRRAIKPGDELLRGLQATPGAEPAHVLKTLIDSRVIRVDEDEASGEDRYELAHDYLLTEIDLDPMTQARKAAEELLVRELVAYERFGTLLSKDRYAIISSQRSYLQLNPQAEALLARSERELTRQARLQTTIVLGAAVFFAFLALLAGSLWIQSRNLSLSLGVETTRAVKAEQLAEDNLVIATIAQGQAIDQAAIATRNLATAVAANATAQAESTRAIAAEMLAQERAVVAETRQANAFQNLMESVSTLKEIDPYNPLYSGSSLIHSGITSEAVILDVAYRSMWDVDASGSASDPGTTNVAMLLNSIGIFKSSDEILRDLFPEKGPNDYQTFMDLVIAIRVLGDTYGVELEYRASEDEISGLELLYDSIDNGKPLIALINYEPWTELSNNAFKGGHYVTIVGYDKDAIYVHDPLFGLWEDAEKGAYFKVPLDLFIAGWGGFSPMENPNYTAIVPRITLASRLDIALLSSPPAP